MSSYSDSLYDSNFNATPSNLSSTPSRPALKYILVFVFLALIAAGLTLFFVLRKNDDDTDDDDTNDPDNDDNITTSTVGIRLNGATSSEDRWIGFRGDGRLLDPPEFGAARFEQSRGDLYAMALTFNVLSINTVNGITQIEFELMTEDGAQVVVVDNALKAFYTPDLTSKKQFILEYTGYSHTWSTVNNSESKAVIQLKKDTGASIMYLQYSGTFGENIASAASIFVSKIIPANFVRYDLEVSTAGDGCIVIPYMPSSYTDKRYTTYYQADAYDADTNVISGSGTSSSEKPIVIRGLANEKTYYIQVYPVTKDLVGARSVPMLTSTVKVTFTPKAIPSLKSIGYYFYDVKGVEKKTYRRYSEYADIVTAATNAATSDPLWVQLNDKSFDTWRRNLLRTNPPDVKGLLFSNHLSVNTFEDNFLSAISSRINSLRELMNEIGLENAKIGLLLDGFTVAIANYEFPAELKLTALAAENSDKITVNNATTIEPSDYLLLVHPTNNTIETVRVKSKSGNQVTLNTKLTYDFPVETRVLFKKLTLTITDTDSMFVAPDDLNVSFPAWISIRLNGTTSFGIPPTYLTASNSTTFQLKLPTTYDVRSIYAETGRRLEVIMASDNVIYLLNNKNTAINLNPSVIPFMQWSIYNAPPQDTIDAFKNYCKGRYKCGVYGYMVRNYSEINTNGLTPDEVDLRVRDNLLLMDWNEIEMAFFRGVGWDPQPVTSYVIDLLRRTRLHIEQLAYSVKYSGAE